MDDDGWKLDVEEFDTSVILEVYLRWDRNFEHLLEYKGIHKEPMYKPNIKSWVKFKWLMRKSFMPSNYQKKKCKFVRVHHAKIGMEWKTICTWD